MDTFGDRLKVEREACGLDINGVAETLRVDPRVLTALEHNDFAALPAEDVMRELFSGYAEVLDVDADLMIEDYLRERENSLAAFDTETPAPPGEPPVPLPAPTDRRWRWPLWPVWMAVAVLAAWWVVARNGAPPAPRPPEISAPVEPRPLSSAQPAGVDPAPTESPVAVGREPATATEPSTEIDREPATSTEPPTGIDREAPTPTEPPRIVAAAAPRSVPRTQLAPTLRVADHGVGAAVENRRLVGRSDSFRVGTRVYFWTHVQGGAPGRKVDHVWLRGGAEADRISLEVGGPSWRTYSAKTLPPGSSGQWAVEARDEEGRVLARTDFVSR